MTKKLQLMLVQLLKMLPLTLVQASKTLLLVQ